MYLSIFICVVEIFYILHLFCIRLPRDPKSFSWISGNHTTFGSSSFRFFLARNSLNILIVTLFLVIWWLNQCIYKSSFLVDDLNFGFDVRVIYLLVMCSVVDFGLLAWAEIHNYIMLRVTIGMDAVLMDVFLSPFVLFEYGNLCNSNLQERAGKCLEVSINIFDTHIWGFQTYRQMFG